MNKGIVLLFMQNKYLYNRWCASLRIIIFIITSSFINGLAILREVKHERRVKHLTTHLSRLTSHLACFTRSIYEMACNTVAVVINRFI